MRSLVFCGLLFVAYALATPTPRRPRLTDKRVVGGQDAEPGQFPWQISFRYYDSHFCGGSVLDENTTITAAHCCDGWAEDDPLTIVAGDHSLASEDDENDVSVEVVKVIIHEGFNWNLENDICLLKLGTPLELNEFIAPIALPAEANQEPAESDILIASGWGTLSSGGNLADILQWVEVPYVTDAQCQDSYGEDSVTASMICAGNLEEGGVDTCQGDSGGPLVTQDLSSLVGLTSWGYGCAAPGNPGVYTQVSYFLEWIEENRS